MTVAIEDVVTEERPRSICKMCELTFIPSLVLAWAALGRAALGA